MSLDLSRIPTPHNKAVKEDLADVVLMPGDPLRSRFIAENFLTDAKLFNDIRGVQGYTGLYEGKRVSVMASGIGIPSISVYAYELFNFYDTEAIIRVGTAGGIKEGLKVGDILIADCALTDSDFYKHFRLPENYVARPDKELFDLAVQIAKDGGKSYHVGTVLTEEIYYAQEDGNMIEYWAEKGVMAFEMEAAALYANAVQANKKALAIFTVSNDILTGEEMDPADREKALTDMIEVSLKTAVRM